MIDYDAIQRYLQSNMELVLKRDRDGDLVYNLLLDDVPISCGVVYLDDLRNKDVYE